MIVPYYLFRFTCYGLYVNNPLYEQPNRKKTSADTSKSGKSKMEENKINVGGQAIIEGVMMRSPHSLAIACRRQSGEIVVTERVWESLWEKFTFLRWPFLRGTIVLIESLMNGIQALMFSANQALIEPKDKEESGEETETSSEAEVKEEPEQMSKLAIIGTIIFSLGFAFLVFKGIPHMLASVLGLSTEHFLFHLLDGVIKISMFIGYVLLISRMEDIKRVFQYHGAEHKSIYAYENGEELTVENARKYTTLHPRCGTSFIIIVLLSSILVFMVVFPFLPQFHPNRWINALIQVAVKLPLMLPIAGVSYEFLKWSSKHMDNPVIRMLVKPGLWLQLITTREPDDEQLEVALVSLRKALWREKVGSETLNENKSELEYYSGLRDVSF